MNGSTVPTAAPERTSAEGTGTPPTTTLAPRTPTRVDVRTPPPRTPNRIETESEPLRPALPHFARDAWLTPVRFGPATRGDMELLAEYLVTPPTGRSSSTVAAPLGQQFYDVNVSGVMDAFYRHLQNALFISVEDDESVLLDEYDWTGKLLNSEKRLLESVKRFILHTALFCARATEFASRGKAEKLNDPSQKDKVDCLRDYVEDFVALAQFLKTSCESEPGELPSLKAFMRQRINELEALAKARRRPQRQYFFRLNSERNTHIYVRKACCVMLGLANDYDQHPEFGLNEWKRNALVFDNIEQLLWKGFGLKFKEEKRELEKLAGSIVDLEANFIATGPFRFVHTSRPQEHLTLDRDGGVRIYTSKALASTAYLFQNHIIARAAGVSHLGFELARSHALLFLQTPTHFSRRLADELHLDLEGISFAGGGRHPYDFKRVFYDAIEWGNIPRLEDFDLLRPRLAELQREMNDWRPQNVRQLFKRGYNDPLTWYGFWFAGFVGVVGILALAVSITQTVGQFVSLK